MPDTPAITQVTVRYFAAPKAAIGMPEESVDVREITDIAALIARAPESARPVLERCSFLVDGASTTDLATPLAGARLVDALPPFAGG